MITVSAPGKLMLMGEHAVVYGAPCMVTAVTRRLSVTAEATGTDGAIVEAPQVKETKFVDKTIEKFFTTVGKNIKTRGVKLVIQSEFTHNVGFGSSSAVSVATLKALGAVFQIPLDNRQIFDLAYQVTLDLQGVGSGFDIAAATYGGTLYFKKGGEIIDPLPDHVPLIVGYSGVKADTPTLVRQVAEKRKQYPEKVNRIFEAIGKLVLQGKEALCCKDWEVFGKLMNFNQEYIRDLGVSSEKLEILISAAKQAGALGAKLSGAGGGDCMIAIASNDKAQAIRQAITDAGGEVIDVSPNADGVRIETTDDQEEFFVVVDEYDNIISHRPRYDCHHDKTLIHRAVGVVIFDDKGRALLTRRSLTKDTHPGWWGISSAGHVAKGESYDDAVRRELKEELGIEIPVRFAKKFLYEDGQESEYDAVFTAVYDGPLHPDATEVADVRFVAKGELPRMLLSKEIQLTPCSLQGLQAIGFLS